MSTAVNLETVLAANRADRGPLRLFALLNLGVIESLANGALGITEAIHLFFNADNCLFVRKSLGDKIADEIMSRGVQLGDLFSVLPTDAAQREFQHELTTMRGLCLKLLRTKRRVA